MKVIKAAMRILAEAKLPEMRALRQLRRDIGRLPRYQPGQAKVWGWDIEFVDSASCISAFDYTVVRKWLDFDPNNTSPYIIDCGANIGLSVLHFKKTFPDCRITAFEPDPDICRVLKRNVTANGLKKVEIVERALWNEDGEIQFISDKADGGHLSFEAHAALGQTVKAERLRKYLEEPVDLLKMDIEGAETRVLSDCSEILGNVAAISLEYHSMFDRRQDLDEVLTVLGSNGFRYYINSFDSWINLRSKPPRINHPYDQLLMISAKKCDAW